MTTFMPPAANWPITVLVGPAATADGKWGAPTYNITSLVDMDSLRIAESGNYEPGTADFDVVQAPPGKSMPSNFPYFTDYLVNEGTVLIKDGTEEVFRGNIRQFKPSGNGIYRTTRVSAVDIGSLLDKTIISAIDKRPAGETDKQRISYLFATYGFAMPNVDLSGVQVLETNLGRQTFSNCTLRQALEKVLAQASPTANYWIDASGRLRTWDRNNPDLNADGTPRVAPYDIVVGGQGVIRALDNDELAPEDLVIDWDTSAIINWVKVRGVTAAGRLIVTDNVSIASYGRRQAFIDAPDADTDTKAIRVGLALLADAADPQARGSFSIQGPRSSKYGARWRPAQTVRVTSPFHGLLREPYRINRVTTRYISGEAARYTEVEFGGRRKWLRTGFER